MLAMTGEGATRDERKKGSRERKKRVQEGKSEIATERFRVPRDDGKERELRGK